MLDQKIKISFIGMEPTEALKSYVKEKISKYENLLDDATSIEVFLKESKSNRGVNDDFRIDINVSLPETRIRVEQRGENMYANIDEASDVLNRRLTRYNEMKDHWSGEKPWKMTEAEMSMNNEEDTETNVIYIPKITKRKTMDDMTPLEEAEAIERMEMAGYDQYLFKNKSTNKISMIYRRIDGGYGLVEPKD
ncbi:MAG TPA: ribosome-associated translation inhibitor RaiA [Candidatus Dojkabacteria bacterium]|nr:ribosome-associated translation inhibitor RaiA [Candidatus Dojkabacteria bacterium]